MRVTVFSARPHDREFLAAANRDGRHQLEFVEARLSARTAALVAADAVCLFVNDVADAAAIAVLAANGVRLITLRCTGFNNVELPAARQRGIAVGRVAAYSPHAVAEHAVGLMLTLDRKIHRAYNRVREGNFRLDGLLGFDLYGKTVGIVGTGQIGETIARILAGFGCRLLATDPVSRATCEAIGVSYVALDQLLAEADIVTLHCPLTPATHHLIDAAAFARMKRGAMLINTSRGGVVDTGAAIAALKRQHLGYLGIDVYEEEAEIFYEDRSGQMISDDLFARLLSFPNVLITGHQGFYTREALTQIAEATIANCDAFERTGRPIDAVEIG